MPAEPQEEAVIERWNHKGKAVAEQWNQKERQCKAPRFPFSACCLLTHLHGSDGAELRNHSHRSQIQRTGTLL